MRIFNYFLMLLFFACLSCLEKVNNVDEKATSEKFQKSELRQNTVISESHPIALWEKKVTNPKGIILFVHGRTWSSIPDFDLQVEGEDLSLMDGVNAQGYTAYAVDLRGYGGTPRDSSGWNSPQKAANDVENILDWISTQNKGEKVHLFGWSMGSTISLLTAMQAQSKLKTLTVFGYWQDLDNKIAESDPATPPERRANTAEAAASDFITAGSISQKAIDKFVETALKADPVRADWRYQHQYNEIVPEKIEIPVLILQGELDPIGPTAKQAKLFTRLKTTDKTWVVISGGDHAAFMETLRPQFIKSFVDFIERFK
ncbi:MAG: alpha/beta fold hydrolase [Bacteroidota bacterium]